jgi:cytochrome c2
VLPKPLGPCLDPCRLAVETCRSDSTLRRKGRKGLQKQRKPLRSLRLCVRSDRRGFARKPRFQVKPGLAPFGQHAPGFRVPGVCCRNLLAMLVILSSVVISRAQDPAVFFRTNCYSCHTIGGGRITGPDLKDVLKRQERRWLVNFMQNPKEVIDSGDPTAVQLAKEARGVIMPRVPGMNQSLAEALLDLIEKEGQLEESHFMGLQLSDRPISPEEIAEGRNIFLGVRRLANGGPACISCHSVAGVGGLGGGHIGPDLTKVFERLGGRRAVASWLLAPATPTMSSVFRSRPFAQEDITVIAAFLEDEAKNKAEADPTAQRSTLLFVGLLGAAVCLAAGSRIWKDRSRGR